MIFFFKERRKTRVMQRERDVAQRKVSRQAKKPVRTVYVGTTLDPGRVVTIREQRIRITKLENDNSILEERICALEEERVVATKVNGKTYSNDVRKVVYHCVQEKVAVEKIGSVVCFILETLGGVRLKGSFPSEACCRQMVREMNVISQLHVSSELGSKASTTLKFDGTTKSKQHWIESQVSFH